MEGKDRLRGGAGKAGCAVSGEESRDRELGRSDFKFGDFFSREILTCLGPNNFKWAVSSFNDWACCFRRVMNLIKYLG